MDFLLALNLVRFCQENEEWEKIKNWVKFKGEFRQEISHLLIEAFYNRRSEVGGDLIDFFRRALDVDAVGRAETRVDHAHRDVDRPLE